MRREVRTMLNSIELDQTRKRREDEIRDAVRARQLRSDSSVSLRRTVGRTIIRIGELMAQEQSISLARHR
jgi:hypothetical protein